MQKVITIIIVILAIIGMVFVVQKQRNEKCIGGKPGEGCPGCALRDQCNKKEGVKTSLPKKDD